MNGTESEGLFALSDRFYANTESRGECLIWTGYKCRNGLYGSIYWNGKQWRAHRLAWRLGNGPIPEGVCVLHSCDTPLCVRREHLFLGTQADNMADRNAKRRFHAKLSPQQVALIRGALRNGEKQGTIAEEYGISTRNVRKIASGASWKGV